jgi:YbbR domain-containing protein
MKKKMFLAGIFFLAGFAVKAENVEKASLVMLQNKRVLLETTNPQKQIVHLQIFEASTLEQVYHAKLTRDIHYKRSYDLSGLSEGNYLVKVVFDNRVFVKEIQLGSNFPVLIREAVYDEPRFSQDGRSLEITLSNHMDEKVGVSFSRDTETFFKDEPVYSGTIRRKYDLTNLEPGFYSVEVSAGDRYYQHSFQIR